jgi:hypothetical protein
MTTYRIVSREFLHDGKTTAKYILAQYRTWYWPVWRNIKHFYKSEFEDMPGVWTDVCPDKLTAKLAIKQFKQKKSTFDTLL